MRRGEVTQPTPHQVSRKLTRRGVREWLIVERQAEEQRSINLECPSSERCGSSARNFQF